MALSETTTGASAAVAGSQTTATQQDTQTLIALLGNLMPLLVRIQSQAAVQPFQAGFVGFVPQSATLDQQAAVTLVEDVIADCLRNLSTYLDTNATQYTGLEACTPLVTQAVQCYAGRDYAQAFNLIHQTYRSIAALRSINPQLPPLRAAAPVTPPAASTKRH